MLSLQLTRKACTVHGFCLSFSPKTFTFTHSNESCLPVCLVASLSLSLCGFMYPPTCNQPVWLRTHTKNEWKVLLPIAKCAGKENAMAMAVHVQLGAQQPFRHFGVHLTHNLASWFDWSATAAAAVFVHDERDLCDLTINKHVSFVISPTHSWDACCCFLLCLGADAESNHNNNIGMFDGIYINGKNINVQQTVLRDDADDASACRACVRCIWAVYVFARRLRQHGNRDKCADNQAKRLSLFCFLCFDVWYVGVDFLLHSLGQIMLAPFARKRCARRSVLGHRFYVHVQNVRNGAVWRAKIWLLLLLWDVAHLSCRFNGLAGNYILHIRIGRINRVIMRLFRFLLCNINLITYLLKNH